MNLRQVVQFESYKSTSLNRSSCKAHTCKSTLILTKKGNYNLTSLISHPYSTVPQPVMRVIRQASHSGHWLSRGPKSCQSTFECRVRKAFGTSATPAWARSRRRLALCTDWRSNLRNSGSSWNSNVELIQLERELQYPFAFPYS